MKTANQMLMLGGPPATVLQGPADADAFRVKVGRYGDRWYTDTLPGCDIAPASEWVGPSVSQVKKAKPFEGADFVAMKRIALELAGRAGTIDTLTYAEMYERFKSVNKLGLQAAGQRGTHVHKMAEQMLYGRPVDTDGPGGHYHGALADFFDAHQPELIGAEIVFMHRDLHGHGYGGTGDAILRIAGQTALIDWKSRGEDADHAAYPEEGAQIAAYARAQYAIAAGTESAHRIAVPQLDVGLIISVKPDGCRVYPVDLDQAARTWESLHAWWCARLDEKKSIGRPWPTKRATTPPAEQIMVDTPRPAAAQAGAIEVVERMRANLLERVDAIRVKPAALQSLAAKWSIDLTDVPTFKADHQHTTAELGRILAVVQSVEDEHRMPFASEVPGPDEGSRCSDDDFDAVAAGLAALPDAGKLLVKQIMDQAREAGRIVSVSALRSKRRVLICGSLIAMAAEMDEEHVRAALALVVGDMQESITTGAYVGALTLAEATRLVEIATAFSEGRCVLSYDGARPVLALAS